MQRFILIDSARLDALKVDYLNYKLYFSTFDEAYAAAQELKSRCWIMKTTDYLEHIYNPEKNIKGKILYYGTL